MNSASESAGGPPKKTSNARHVFAVGGALLFGAIGSIFVAMPVFDPENAWHAPIHEYLNSRLPMEWRWHGKNAILAAVTVTVVAVPTFLAYVCVPCRCSKSQDNQGLSCGLPGQSSARQDCESPSD